MPLSIDTVRRAQMGAEARNESLDPNERSAIARKAAKARWNSTLPKATHTGILRIGATEIPCAVLDDGTRLLTQEGFLTAIGRAGKAKAGTGGLTLVDGLPPFLVAENLKRFISEDLRESTTPVVFQTAKGARAFGYKADLLPKVCDVYLQARAEGELKANQTHIAKACEILMRGLAHVGIIALVDEATGYQYDRARRDLEQILARFVSKELLKWVKTFPDEFYQQLFRIKGWTQNKISQRRPPHVGKLTNNLVYERLAPGVLEELRRVTPKSDTGRPKHHYHRRLTEDVGHPKLREHLASLIVLMRACDDWPSFFKLVNRSLPKYGPVGLFTDGQSGSTLP